MRGKISVSLLLFLAVVLCALNALGQVQDQKGQLYMLEDIAVKPSMLKNLKAHVKTVQRLAGEYNFPYPIYVYSSDDMHYLYSFPIANFADIDKFNNAKMKWAERMGSDNLQSLLKSGEGVYEYLKWYVMRHIPELSYMPEVPRFKLEEALFRIVINDYVIPGKEMEYEGVLKEIITLSKEKNNETIFYAYIGDIGTEQPLYMLVFIGENRAELWSNYSKEAVRIGGELGVLVQKLMSLTRSRDVKAFKYHPSLSFVPEKD
jgi:hypothetical protein